ncbi:MAG: hypothetical protein NVS4B3_05150 [Gemmatimonadaceae bacterium]
MVGPYMHRIIIVCQIAAALGLLNVWLPRFNRPTPYRGANAQSMRAEFAAYGLPAWFVVVVGVLKVGSALALIAGLWYPNIVRPTALLIVVLMLGALSMHFKVGDPLRKYVPAAGMLALALTLVVGSTSG